MATAWEYKVITQRRKGIWKLAETPDDADLIATLNREGGLGWELVSAVQTDRGGAVALYLKRPR